MACEHRWIFNLHFTPLLEQQACKRPLLAARMHVWTLELTQALLDASTSCSNTSSFLRFSYDDFKKVRPSIAMACPSGWPWLSWQACCPTMVPVFLLKVILFVETSFHSTTGLVTIFGKIIPRAPDNIKSINGSKETPKIAIRITDLWFVGTPNRSEQAKMVIIDSHGDAIHVVCKQDQLKSWKADLMENCTYVMHNFKVMKNDGQFRIFDHQYKLVFTGVTVVRQSDLEDLPFKKYKFADFTNVIAGLFQPELLVDIIGVVDEVVFHHVGSKSTRVVFKLKDLRHSAPVSFDTWWPGEFAAGSSQLSSKDAFLSKVEAKTISEINNISEEGDVDLNVSPQAIDKLLGYVLAFKVKVQPKFNNVAVLRYSNDLDLVNAVVDMLPDAEACSKVHAPILDSDNPFQLEEDPTEDFAFHTKKPS
ncbi:hypothetical protein JHK86_052569 [Glycine max]|nr:hypothetical protein JHK86_052569 [Glycine max]